MSCPHLVPGNQCLDTGKNGFEYPICNCVHSYSISLWQTPFSNMSLAASTKSWIASEITKTMCTQGPGAHFCARVQRDVFALVPCEYRTVNMINDYFVGLTDHFAPLRQGASPVCVPHEYLVSEREALSSMSSLKISKAVGPDKILNKILKEFAHELAPRLSVTSTTNS